MYNVLIADDEAIECHVLTLMLKNHFEQLTVLPHASNGLELIAAVESYHPDIAVVDINMPSLNGLEALEMIRQKNRSMKILIVSAYSEFAYAKKALALGAADYILKPVQPDDFVRAVQKICADLDQEHSRQEQARRHQEMISEFDQMVEEDFLSNLILGELSPKNAMRLLQSLKSPYRGGILVTLRPAPRPEVSFSFPWENYALAIQKQLGQLCTCFGKWYHRDFILCLLPGMSFEKDLYQDWIREIFHVAFQKADPQFRCPLLCGVSSVKLNLNDLPHAFQESALAIHQKTDPDLYFFEYCPPSSPSDPYRKIFEPCLEMLRGHQIRQCTAMADSIFSSPEIFKESLPFLKVKTCYFLFRLNTAFSAPSPHRSVSGDSWIFFWELLSCAESCEEVRRVLLRGIHAVASRTASYSHPQNPHIARSLLYMKQHYMEDLSLDLVAKNTNVSSFYLSRLFKQELRRNFLEVLTNIRIQRAIELLPDSRLSVREISEMVGYLNAAYFYKVFKKHVGVSVSQIREYLQSCCFSPSLPHS